MWLIARSVGAMGLLLAISSSCLASVTPVGWYRLGEDDPGAGPTTLGQDPTFDHTAAHLNLNRFGQPHYSSDVAPGASDATGSVLSMSFSHVAHDTYYRDFLKLPDDNFGIEAWVKSGLDPSVDQTSVVAYDGAITADGIGLLRVNNSTPFGGTQSTFVGMLGAQTVGSVAVTSDWVHLALVRAGGTNTFYVNAQPVGSNTDSFTFPTQAFSIGAAYCTICDRVDPTSNYLDGTVDEVRLFTFDPGQFDAQHDLLYSSIPDPGCAILVLAPAWLLLRRP